MCFLVCGAQPWHCCGPWQCCNFLVAHAAGPIEDIRAQEPTVRVRVMADDAHVEKLSLEDPVPALARAANKWGEAVQAGGGELNRDKTHALASYAALARRLREGLPQLGIAGQCSIRDLGVDAAGARCRATKV